MSSSRFDRAGVSKRHRPMLINDVQEKELRKLSGCVGTVALLFFLIIAWLVWLWVDSTYYNIRPPRPPTVDDYPMFMYPGRVQWDMCIHTTDDCSGHMSCQRFTTGMPCDQGCLRAGEVWGSGETGSSCGQCLPYDGNRLMINCTMLIGPDSELTEKYEKLLVMKAEQRVRVLFYVGSRRLFSLTDLRICRGLRIVVGLFCTRGRLLTMSCSIPACRQPKTRSNDC